MIKRWQWDQVNPDTRKNISMKLKFQEKHNMRLFWLVKRGHKPMTTPISPKKLLTDMDQVTINRIKKTSHTKQQYILVYIRHKKVSPWTLSARSSIERDSLFTCTHGHYRFRQRTFKQNNHHWKTTWMKNYLILMHKDTGCNVEVYLAYRWNDTNSLWHDIKNIMQINYNQKRRPVLEEITPLSATIK